MTDVCERLRTALAGRYRVEDALGEGGMAIVLRAEDLKHDRRVAIKVLREELGRAVGADRFLHEIRVTAALHHPHILPLLDSGEADGLLYYVMPLVEGESLRHRLERERQLPLEEALRIARETADALAHAHRHNLVHRDIKPENILFVAGHAVVSDFGIARAIEETGNDSLTYTGMTIGTPVYMSPEQASGDQDIDGRSDVYSLGCVLYEMLAGEAPFAGPNALAILAKKITASVPKVSTARVGIPPWVERVLGKALASAPADRYATAQELAAALQAPADGQERNGEGPARRHAVAVLPFVSISADADDEYLSDGITEEIIHALSRVERIQVVARTSAFAFKGSSHDVRAIGEKLNVGRIVEGSVRRARNRLRITAQLIDAADGFELWSERYERDVDDVFAIQDEIAAAVAGKLRELMGAEVRTPRPSAPPPKVFAAYEHYLKGRHHWNARTPGGLARSLEHLEQALALDPGFALAHAALADTYVTQGVYGIAAPGEVLPLARAAADRALALHDTLAEALTARACVSAIHDWDWEAAARDFEQAVAADPDYPTAHQARAMYLAMPLGRFAEAREHLERARALDPLSLSVAVSRAALHYYARETDPALAECRAALELDERSGLAHYFQGLVLEQAGRAPEAVTVLELAAASAGERPSPEIRAALGHALAGVGERDRARAILRSLEEEARERWVSPFLLAQLEIGLGERDRALTRLEEARAARAADLVWLGVRPHFDPLRGDPRFAALLAELGLPSREVPAP